MFCLRTAVVVSILSNFQISYAILSELSVKIKFPIDLNDSNLDVLKNDTKIYEDAFLTSPQLIAKYGYPVEVITVATVDGYLVDVHRIPKRGGIPVLMVHGITDSSGGWLIMGPEKGLGYILADSGYDVWMLNARGTRYSRKHRWLNTSSKEYWNFSFHEIGIYDLPATIDHIIAETGFKQIHYIGYSQGTTSFWIMCSELPSYCSKIIIMNALAPVAYMKHSKSPLIQALSFFVDKLEILFMLAGKYEFLPRSELLAISGQVICRDRAITQAICSNVIFLITGYDTEQLNTTTLPVIFGHIPAGAATKQFVHYGQFVHSGNFRQYDYGVIRNIVKYGVINPPPYNLSRVTAPVALHYGNNDWLAATVDVIRLANNLPNVRERHLVDFKKFTHSDFMYAIDSRALVYDRVIEIMRKAETNELKSHETSV